LAALGVGGYYATDQASWTALIPAVFGLAIFGLGVAGLKESFRKHAMHAAALLGLIGFAATISGLVQLLGKVFSEPALLSKSAMAILCGAFVALAVKSFIDARRKKPDAQAEGPGSGSGTPSSPGT
jgi:hypothetical protein